MDQSTSKLRFLKYQSSDGLLDHHDFRCEFYQKSIEVLFKSKFDIIKIKIDYVSKAV